jgi:hypothetical protein
VGETPANNILKKELKEPTKELRKKLISIFFLSLKLIGRYINIEILMNYNQTYCSNCDINIAKYAAIYMACDLPFCSIYCRTKQLEIIILKDPLLTSPTSWRDIRVLGEDDDATHFPSLKKTQSYPKFTEVYIRPVSAPESIDHMCKPVHKTKEQLSPKTYTQPNKMYCSSYDNINYAYTYMLPYIQNGTIYIKETFNYLLK